MSTGKPQTCPQVGDLEMWLDAMLMPRPELNYDIRGIDADEHVVVEDPLRGKYFQIGVSEYRLLQAFDGRRTLRQIIEEQLAEFAVPALDASFAENPDASQILLIAQCLYQNNLIFMVGADSSKRLGNQNLAMRRSRMMAWLNPISYKIKLFNPNQLLKSIEAQTSWMFTGWAFFIWLLAGGYALSIVFHDWEKLTHSTMGIFSGSRWFWMLLIWLLLKVVHEFAHGVACRRYGGEVPEAGVLLLLFTPMAYVNVTSMWRFPNRWHRLIVAAAGMYVELFISFLALIVWQRSSGIIGELAFNLFFMSSVTTVLFNANPLMRFDGYFMLSDLLGVPNLYGKGTKWFVDQFKQLYLGIPAPRSAFKPYELRCIQIYGTLAWFWKSLICVSLIIGASVLFHGAGIALAAMAAVIWYGLPLSKRMKLLFSPDARRDMNFKRLGWSGGLTMAVVIAVFGILKAPATKSAPAIVQFSNETILRAQADGFVRNILVSDGETVQKNQILMVLENQHLSLQLSELEHLARESQIESRIHANQGELAQAQTAEQRQQSLMKQIAEVQEQLAGLQVQAPFSGVVFQRALPNRLDTYVKQGDPLLSIANADSKEIIVSIDQRDLASIEGQHGQTLRVALPGKKVFQAPLTRINPRAQLAPQHPSLGANYGGLLPVQARTGTVQDGESRFELLEPHFTVTLSVAGEFVHELSSGQRGRAFFETKRQSLGGYLYVAVGDWLKHKIKIATQSAAF